MKVLFKALLTFAALIVAANGLAYQEGNYELSDAEPHSCEKMIELHRFYGTCCSLKNTDSDGCVLNVANGWCKAVGQYWSKTWNSTNGRIQCQDSDYDTSEFIKPCPNPSCPDGWEYGYYDDEDDDPANTLTLMAVSSIVGVITIALL